MDGELVFNNNIISTILAAAHVFTDTLKSYPRGLYRLNTNVIVADLDKGIYYADEHESRVAVKSDVAMKRTADQVFDKFESETYVRFRRIEDIFHLRELRCAVYNDKHELLISERLMRRKFDFFREGPISPYYAKLFVEAYLKNYFTSILPCRKNTFQTDYSEFFKEMPHQDFMDIFLEEIDLLIIKLNKVIKGHEWNIYEITLSDQGLLSVYRGIDYRIYDWHITNNVPLSN